MGLLRASPLVLFSVHMNVPTGRLTAIAVLCAALTNCAQTGPPLPPSLELPKPPSDLRANRKGNAVALTWSEPVRTTDRQSVRYLGLTRVCRSIETDMKECGAPAAQVPPLPARPSGATAAAQLQTQVYTDTLPSALEELNPTSEITYAVEVLNRDGRSAGLSNRVRVPAAPTLPPPSDFRAELTGDAVILTWTSAGESAGTHEVLHRYRIYRRDETSGKEVVVNEIPLGDARPVEMRDSSFEWEKTYSYRATVVSAARIPKPGPCSDPSLQVTSDCSTELSVEGDDTPAVKVVAHDIFPPAVPAGLQAVYSGEGQKLFIDLIWAPVTNADLAGYNVYRRESNGESIKLNSDPVKAPSYRDSAVFSGKTYVYSVSAVDVRGNVSARSQAASETTP